MNREARLRRRRRFLRRENDNAPNTRVSVGFARRSTARTVNASMEGLTMQAAIGSIRSARGAKSWLWEYPAVLSWLRPLWTARAIPRRAPAMFSCQQPD